MEQEISLSQIDNPPNDLRFYRSETFFKLFCSDIEKNGVLVKPIVRKKPDGKYECVDGVNRLKCLKKLGYKTVICDVQDISNEKDSIIVGLLVNIKRSFHDPMGVSFCLLRLKEEYKMKQVELCKAFGFSKSHVSKLITIAKKLKPIHQLALSKGEINIPQAYDLVKKRWKSPRAKIPRNKCMICESEKTFFELEINVNVCKHCISERKKQLDQERKKYEREQEQSGLMEHEQVSAKNF